MKERSDINWSKLLETPVDRRQALRFLAVGTAILLSGSGCDLVLGPSWKELPSLEASSEFVAEIQKSVAPIRRILTPVMGEFNIKLHPSSNGRNGGFAGYVHGYSFSHNEMHLFFPDTSEVSLQVGRLMAVHEATHIFNIANGNFPWKYLSDEMTKRLGKNNYSNDQYKILTESTYQDDSRLNKMGHPQNNYDELLASTVTVLRYHPAQFIKKNKST